MGIIQTQKSQLNHGHPKSQIVVRVKRNVGP